MSLNLLSNNHIVICQTPAFLLVNRGEKSALNVRRMEYFVGIIESYLKLTVFRGYFMLCHCASTIRRPA
jgi:hypothetical protein